MTAGQEIPRRHRWIAAAIVVLLAFFAFTPALDNRYALDDNLARPIDDKRNTDHPLIIDLHPPWVYFGEHYWFGKTPASRLYRPVTILSYSYVYHALSRPWLPDTWPRDFLSYKQDEMEELLQREALPQHALNMLLHCWAALLVLWLMFDLGACLVGAALTAALFAAHALHSEVVAGVVGRAELFAFCLGLAGVLAYRRFENSGSRLWSVLAAVGFFLALCSKESAIAWLPFLPCYLMVRGWRAPAPESFREVLRRNRRGLLAVLVPGLLLFLALRAGATWGMDARVWHGANPLFHEPIATRLMSAITILGFAIYKCLWPFSLSYTYGPNALPIIESVLDYRFLLSATVLAGCLWFGLRRPAQRPMLFLCVAFFFGFSFITSNIPLPIGIFFAERLYYTPSLGVCILPALLLPRVSRLWRWVIVALAVVWMAACVVIDLQRSRVWMDNQILILADVESQPMCAQAHVKASGIRRWLMGIEKDKSAEHKAAATAHLDEAERIDPGSVILSATRAEFLATDGDPMAAIAELKKALTKERLPISGSEAAVRRQLGRLLMKHTSQHRLAIEQFRTLYELMPENILMRADLIEHGMKILPAAELHDLIQVGIERRPSDLRFRCFEAVLYGRDPRSDPQVIEQLHRILQSLPERIVKESAFIEGRLQLARSLSRQKKNAAAKTQLDIVLDYETASEAQKDEARAMKKAIH